MIWREPDLPIVNESVNLFLSLYLRRFSVIDPRPNPLDTLPAPSLNLLDIPIDLFSRDLDVDDLTVELSANDCRPVIKPSLYSKRSDVSFLVSGNPSDLPDLCRGMVREEIPIGLRLLHFSKKVRPEAEKEIPAIQAARKILLEASLDLVLSECRIIIPDPKESIVVKDL